MVFKYLNKNVRYLFVGCFMLLFFTELRAQVEVVYIEDQGAVDAVYNTKFKEISNLYRYLERLERDEHEKGFLTFSVDSVILTSDLENSALTQAKVLFHRGERITMDRSMKRMAVDLEAEMERLEDQGFPFARIIVKSKLDSGSVVNSAHVQQGPLIRMDSVVFLEGQELPQSLISKHIGVQKGERYSESRVRAIDRKLKSLPFLRVVRPSAVVFSGNEARTILSLEKRNANRLDGIIGFQPDSEGKSIFTGDVRLELQNALSHLDKLALNWQRVADNSQKLDIGFRFPYLFKTSLGIDASVSQFRQDTTFNEINLEAGVFSVLDMGGALQLFFASKTVNDLLTGADIQKVGTSSIQYGLSYAIDLRDDAINPRAGFVSKLKFSYGDKDINTSLDGLSESNKVGQWMAAADLKKFIPFGNQSTILLRVNSFHINSETLIRNELDRIGGLTTLRGHDEQSLRVSSYLIGTLEYRILTGERSYVNAFSDYGYTISDANDEEVEQWPYGFGLGASIDTGSGILNLSYALGAIGDAPIIVSTGKIHLGYTAVF